ncbi:Sorting nexin-12 [Dirofilaria immitis]|nr:Sorting nexin-12 [Dirofilaria immitis]
MSSSSATVVTQRLAPKRQTLDEAYAPPANFLKLNGNSLKWALATNLPIFKHKESSVRRRYSDFEWLRGELERDSKIVVPPLPGKSLKRQLPFRSDDGIFEETFIEKKEKRVAGHPLAQNERCLHIFLQEPVIDKHYIPGKIRLT